MLKRKPRLSVLENAVLSYFRAYPNTTEDDLIYHFVRLMGDGDGHFHNALASLVAQGRVVEQGGRYREKQ